MNVVVGDCSTRETTYGLTSSHTSHRFKSHAHVRLTTQPSGQKEREYKKDVYQLIRLRSSKTTIRR